VKGGVGDKPGGLGRFHGGLIPGSSAQRGCQSLAGRTGGGAWGLARALGHGKGADHPCTEWEQLQGGRSSVIWTRLGRWFTMCDSAFRYPDFLSVGDRRGHTVTPRLSSARQEKETRLLGRKDSGLLKRRRAEHEKSLRSSVNACTRKEEEAQSSSELILFIVLSSMESSSSPENTHQEAQLHLHTQCDTIKDKINTQHTLQL
ncbi:hypothetical protein JZ751_007945, partial [Albula glossodonta]